MNACKKNCKHEVTLLQDVFMTRIITKGGDNNRIVEALEN